MKDESRPSLRRIHTDKTLESGVSRYSLRFWRQRETKEIIESLRPGTGEALKVKPDGRILDGNIRVKILEERSYDINTLEREMI